MKKKRPRRKLKDPFFEAMELELGGLDPFGLDDLGLDRGIQVVGTPEQFASGQEPKMRPMRLDDLDDDCPICRANRDRILAGDPPMVLAFD